MLANLFLPREGRPQLSQKLTGASSSLRQGMVFACVYNNVGESRLYDLISNQPSATVTSKWSGSRWTPTGSTGNSTNYGTAQQFAINLAQAAFTFVGRVSWDGGGSSAGGGLGHRDDGDSVNAGWQVVCGTTYWGFVIEGSSTNMEVGAAPPSSNKYLNFAIVADGSQTATNQKVYFDGAQQTLTHTVNGIGTRGTDTTRNLIIGQSSWNAGQGGGTFGDFDGIIDFIYIWNRALSHAELMLLQIDGYAPFRYGSATGLLDFIAGGGVVTGVGSSSGAGVATGLAGSTGSSSGAGAATGVGAGTFSATASASGAGVATGVGAATFAGVGSASGAGVATGIGASIFDAIGSAIGVGTATGISNWITNAPIEIDGTIVKKRSVVVPIQKTLSADGTIVKARTGTGVIT